MTSLAAFLAWLLQGPRWFRLAETMRVLLDEAVRLLLDPETGALRALDAQSIRAAERALQAAEAGLSLAVWLLAHLIAGRSTPANWRRARLAPSRRPPTPLALARRACDLCDRLETLDACARRLARRLPAYPAPDARLRESHSRLASIPLRIPRSSDQTESAEANFSPTGGRLHTLWANYAGTPLVGAGFGQTGPPAAEISHARTI